MPLFAPDLYLFGDAEGEGHWHTAHYLEHQQFVSLGLLSSPQSTYPNWDFWFWDRDNKSSQGVWVANHAAVHQVLTRSMGIQGTDLSWLDPGDPGSFDIWLQVHRNEHQNLRSAFGILA